MSGIFAHVSRGPVADAISRVKSLLGPLSRRGAGGSDILVWDQDESCAYVVDGATGNRIHELPVVASHPDSFDSVVLGVCGKMRRESSFSGAAYALNTHDCWAVVDCDLHNRDELKEKLRNAGRGVCGEEFVRRVYIEPKNRVSHLVSLMQLGGLLGKMI